jgi:hypothetical protein
MKNITYSCRDFQNCKIPSYETHFHRMEIKRFSLKFPNFRSVEYISVECNNFPLSENFTTCRKTLRFLKKSNNTFILLGML